VFAEEAAEGTAKAKVKETAGANADDPASEVQRNASADNPTGETNQDASAGDPEGGVNHDASAEGPAGETNDPPAGDEGAVVGANDPASGDTSGAPDKEPAPETTVGAPAGDQPSTGAIESAPEAGEPASATPEAATPAAALATSAALLSPIKRGAGGISTQAVQPDIVLSSGLVDGTGYTVSGTAPDRVLTFTADASGHSYVIKQNETSDFRNIVVASNASIPINIDIMIAGISLTSAAINVPVVALNAGSTVNLHLAGDNYLMQTVSSGNTVGYRNAGISVPVGAALTIDGGGSLTVQGGYYSAGIGGGIGSTTDTTGNSGSVTIKGGTVNVSGTADTSGNAYGAGIGGGYYGSGGVIEITGGTVNANRVSTGSDYGAGIGGGYYGNNGGTIKITGDTVNARTDRSGGSTQGAGIGGGAYGTGGVIEITGGTVNARAYSYAAGIGGGRNRGGGNIKITGGTVTASGSKSIGGGPQETSNSGTIEITGGKVNAGDIGTDGDGGVGRYQITIGAVGGGSLSPTVTSGSIISFGGSITINSGKINATMSSMYDIAVIGGQGCVIKINDGEVTARGRDNNGYSNQGIGGIGAEINITGGTVDATGYRGGGIGYGESTGFKSITITGGTVTATGTYGGSGIGGKSGTIEISGSAIVTAVGGSNSSGIGDRSATAICGAITIGGSANVTATGGNSTSTSNYSAGIGSAKQTIDEAIVNIAPTATVRAYGMTQAIRSSSVSSGYYVNAAFTAAPSTTTATALYAYPNSQATSTPFLLSLPANYRGFAYSTKAENTQNDEIWANYNVTSGGRVVRNANDSPQIESVNTGALPVKIAGFGSLSVDPRTTTSALLTSTGHPVSAAFHRGGFMYSTSSTLNYQSTPGWTDSTPPQSETITGLEPNTLYYAKKYYEISLGALRFESSSTSFYTLPLITTASAVQGSSEDAALIDADFHVSTVGTNRTINNVKVYWDKDPIDAGNLNADLTAAHSATLTRNTDYNNAGFMKDFAINGLETGVTYNIVIVIGPTSGSNTDSASISLTYEVPEAPEPLINVSVPVKLIFAAFEPDGGVITAPDYHLTNNGETQVKVSITGFAPDTGDPDNDANTLILTATPQPPGPGATPDNDNQFSLYLKGKGAGNNSTGKITEAVSATPLDVCTLEAKDDNETGGADTYNFTLAGDYKGYFAAQPKQPKYQATFKIEAVTE
jgi:hypothetical protein